jgi:diacylglycerol kinase
MGSLYYLVLTFNKDRLFVNLLNRRKKNFLFVSNGFFIKFFEKRKAFKKGKAVKLLVAKYLRKFFLISKIKNLMLIVNNNPVFLLEMLNTINVPIVHKFYDPFSQTAIEEKKPDISMIKFLYFIFLENINFSNNKVRKKGRIKRKILRKLVLKDKLVD